MMIHQVTIDFKRNIFHGLGQNIEKYIIFLYKLIRTTMNKRIQPLNLRKNVLIVSHLFKPRYQVLLIALLKVFLKKWKGC